MDSEDNTDTGTSDAEDDNKKKAELAVKKARKVELAKKAIEQLNANLRKLRLLGGRRVQEDVRMGQAANRIEVNDEYDSEPRKTTDECYEADDECSSSVSSYTSSSSDPPPQPIPFWSFQPPSFFNHTKGHRVTIKWTDHTLSSKLQQQGQQLRSDLPLSDLPPQTSLSNFIEVRVNAMFKGKNVQHVFVREIHCVPMSFTPSTKLQNFLQQFISSKVLYTQRSLMCFQRSATGCVMFFYLCVQEYDNSCPPPYQNTAYIAMLDSVRLFEPSCKRTNVYNLILLSYLQYLRELGFKNAFLWACPPRPDEEYVFYQRPASQKTPTEAILIEWYTNMMEAGVRHGILNSYSTLYDWCPKTATEFFKAFPYFPGDHWLEQMDETVKTLDKLTLNENEVLVAKNKKILSPSRGKTARIAIGKYEYVFQEILHELKVYRKSFFCMALNNTLIPKVNPKYVISNVLAGSREKILDFQKANQLSVSSLQKAVYSTTLFLFRLYISWQKGCFCNDCKGTFPCRVRCTECEKYLCQKYTVHLHPKHDSALIQIVQWNGEVDSFNRTNHDKYYKDKRFVFFSKYDFTKWANYSAKFETCDEESTDKFVRLYIHVKKCQSGKKCIVCKSLMEFFFGPLSPSLPSSPSNTLSTSPSSYSDYIDLGFSEDETETITSDVSTLSDLSDIE